MTGTVGDSLEVMAIVGGVCRRPKLLMLRARPWSVSTDTGTPRRRAMEAPVSLASLMGPAPEGRAAGIEE